MGCTAAKKPNPNPKNLQNQNKEANGANQNQNIPPNQVSQANPEQDIHSSPVHNSAKGRKTLDEP